MYVPAGQVQGFCRAECVSSGWECEVTFPMLLSPSYQTSHRGFWHRTVCQRFSLACPPARWASVAAQLAPGGADRAINASERYTQLPVQSQHHQNEIWAEYANYDYWWTDCSTECTFPADAQPLWEWRKDCIIRFLEQSGEAEVIAHAGALRIVTEQKARYGVLSVLDDSESESTFSTYVFARSAMPNRLAMKLTSQSVANKETNPSALFERAVALCNAANMFKEAPDSESVAHLGKISAEEQSSSTDPITVQHQEVPGVGSFTAYFNGSVLARYNDHTLAHYDGHAVSLLLPDGTRGRVTLHCSACSVSAYVKTLREFRNWAFASSSDIEDVVQNVDGVQSSITTQLDRTERFIKLADHSISASERVSALSDRDRSFPYNVQLD